MTKDELKEYLGRGIQASKKALKKGAEVSKNAIDKAGKAAAKFGDESVLKIEIHQLESDLKKEKILLGESLYKSFVLESKESVSRNDSEISDILKRIEKIRAEISGKEDELKQSEEKTPDSE